MIAPSRRDGPGRPGPASRAAAKAVALAHHRKLGHPVAGWSRLKGVKAREKRVKAAGAQQR
jgi:hypothetical protein